MKFLSLSLRRLVVLSLICHWLIATAIAQTAQPGFGIWMTDVSQAKSFALKHKRPLLVIGNAFNCSHCKDFNDQALEKPAFLDFARKNRIVLFKTTNDTTSLYLKLKSTYQTDCKWDSAVPPFLFLFRVRPEADLTMNNSKALGKDQVELLKVTWDTGKENPFCGKFLNVGITVFGIKIGAHASWNESLAISLVSKFFPNNVWTTPLETVQPPPKPNPDENQKPDPDENQKPDPDTNPPSKPDGDPDDSGNATPTPGTDEKEWLGLWLTDVAKAKTHALKNNRPLLVIGNAFNCSHCKDFNDQALAKPAFLEFARKNRIVLFKTTNDTTSLYLKLKSTYQTDCKWDSAVPPFLFLFRVRPEADLTMNNSKALGKDQVELLKVTWDTGKENPFCGKFLNVGITVFGIKIGKHASWNESLAINLVSKFFPNNVWTTMKPTVPPKPDTPDPDTPGPDTPGPDTPGPDTPGPDHPDPGVDPDDPGALDPTPGTDEKEWLGIWFTNPTLAKHYARNNNRPLLVIGNAFNCSHCNKLRDQALETSDFINFAKKNRLVLFKTDNSSTSLYLKLKSTYQPICNWDGAVPPFLFLFRVKENVDLNTSMADAFSTKQVELLKVTWDTGAENPYCGKFLNVDQKVFGVHFGAYETWQPDLVKQLIGKYFPNNGWTTIVPPATGPTGFEKAPDFGRLANEKHQPEGIVGWGLAPHFEHEKLDQKTYERWYKLTGDQGKRYHFTLRDVKANPDFPVWASFFSTENGKPVTPGKIVVPAKDITQMNHGFYFDAPAGKGLTDQTYYLRLQVDKKIIGSKTAEYAIYAHETVAAPPVGSITNPVWRHSTKTPQKLGQWTMDYGQASLQKAYQDKKPVLLYFTGLNWCPYCLRMEHTVIHSTTPEGTAFRNEIAQTYPILLDFPQRDGSGPALLRDWQENGYLKANGISSEQAQQQAKDNQNLETAFTLPGSDKVGYPSFVYCRVIKKQNAYELEPVGRFSDDILNPQDGTTVLKQLKALYDRGHREATQYPGDLSNNLIPSSSANGTLNLNLGGPAHELWFKFTANKTPHEGESWLFDLTNAGTAPAGTDITLTVLDATGTQVLDAVSATLPDMPHLLFVPESDQQETDYWLKIASKDLQDVSQMKLDFQQKMVISELHLKEETIPVSREKLTVAIPLRLDIHRQPKQQLAFEYRVMATGTNPAPENYFTPVSDWKTFSWDAKETPSFQLPVSVPPEEPDWTGSKTFQLEVRSTETCEVQDGATALIHILALPAFIPTPQTAVELFCGLAAKIEFPVCVTEGTTVSLGDLPKGLTYLSHLDDAQHPRITLQGRPLEAVNNFRSELVLAKNGSATPSDPHKLTLAITVKDTQIPAALIPAFAATLHQAKGGDIAGHITLQKNDQDMTINLTTPEHQKPLTDTVMDWTGYDPQAQKLTLNHVFADDSRLDASVDAQGFGQVTFTNAKGFKYQGELLPIAPQSASYAGTYNVALRRFQDVDGLTEGWASIRVDANGKATARIQLYHDAIAGTVESIICQQKPNKTAAEPDSVLPLFLPFGWNGKAYQGKFAGTLNIVPVSRRIPNTPSTWISGCDYANSILVFNADTRIPLSPCGTVFNPQRTIMECVQEQNLVFVSEPITDLKAVIPNYVKLSETQKFTFQALPDQGLLAPNLKALNVSETDGTFTMQMTALLPQANAPAQTEDIMVTGIMVPTKSDCCGEDANIAVGYGYFRYPQQDGKIYCVRLFPSTTHQYMQLEQPVLSDYDIQAPTITVTCQAKDHLLICQNGTGETRVVNLALTQGKLSLPGQTAWKLAAIPATQEKTESLTVTLAPIADASLTQFSYNPTPSEGDLASNLKPGWNLVAIPLTVMPLPETTFQDSRGMAYPAFQFNEQTQHITRATSLQAGFAYWLYVRPEQPVTLTYKALADQQGEAPALKEGWGLRACPDKITDAMILWRFQNGRFVPITKPDDIKSTEGVWIHQK